MSTVLFLCTGNFYRSRFAEILFNSLAPQHGLAWRAASRGLQAEKARNLGPISPLVIDALGRLGLEVAGGTRGPIQVTQADLHDADLVIATKEAEHRAMIAERFPDWADHVEYWHIDDLDCAGAHKALPELRSEVLCLLSRLQRQDGLAA